MSSADPRRFLAPLTANLMAPVTEAIRRTATSTALHARLADVTCPRCGSLCAIWAELTRCLYQPARDGRNGAPLSTDCREDVGVRCDGCGRTYRTSGRAVGYRLRKGLPPLGA